MKTNVYIYRYNYKYNLWGAATLTVSQMTSCIANAVYTDNTVYSTHSILDVSVRSIKHFMTSDDIVLFHIALYKCRHFIALV